MSQCRQVARDVWLGFAASTRSGGGPSREQRWRLDREAADLALAGVVAAAGFRQDACATSRSHTLGVAVAVAAPAGVRVGVDLVAIDRVGARHAQVVINGDEWRTLEPYASIRPALAWAVKEAAAKATGEPLRCFPHGLRIEAGPPGLMVRQLAGGTGTFVAGWGRFGEFLYAWVRECAT